jgi:adenylate kinase
MFLKCYKKNILKRFFSTNQREVILMMGAPGVGKGTFSKMLSKDFNIPEFSTGEELRRITSENSQSDPQIEKIKQIIKSGKLVDDDTMLNLVKTRLRDDFSNNGIILDGFPRTLNQAVLFDKVTMVIDIFLSEEILIPKILGRRVCKKCGNNYNIFEIKERGYLMDALLPKKHINKCDDCNIDLVCREDDKEDIIRNRLKIYQKHTFPLLDYYKKKNILIQFEPKKGKKDYPALKEIFENFRKIVNRQ